MFKIFNFLKEPKGKLPDQDPLYCYIHKDTLTKYRTFDKETRHLLATAKTLLECYVSPTHIDQEYIDFMQKVNQHLSNLYSRKRDE